MCRVVFTYGWQQPTGQQSYPHHLILILNLLSFQVRSVLITSCPDVMIGLDLSGVNPKNIPVNFKNCGKISFSYINFDRQFSGGQLLKFNMETVNSVKMEDLNVRDALQVSDFIWWIMTCWCL